MKTRIDKIKISRIIFVNCITGLRVVLIPFFIFSESGHNYFLSLALVVVIFATDIADGFLARLLDAVSMPGGIFDSLADFMVVFTLFTYFSIEKVLPFIVPAMVLLSFSIYSINCLLNKKIVYTKLGSASGFLCMLALAILCISRVFLPGSFEFARQVVIYFCSFYLSLAFIENCILILRKI